MQTHIEHVEAPGQPAWTQPAGLHARRGFRVFSSSSSSFIGRGGRLGLRLRLGLGLGGRGRGREATGGERRAGVALLIVLGLIALLMITAVAFTILMRIERASASNLRHTSAARQMAKGALAYAIAALNENIGTNRFPNWPDRQYAPREHAANPGTRPKLHMPEDIFFSVDEDKIDADDVTTARVLSAETARYLPGALRHRAEMTAFLPASSGASVPYDRPEWIPVTARRKSSVGNDVDEIIGRYAYVILNTTGLLDANSVHTNPPGKTARWLGADAGELQLHPSVQMDIANLDDFLNEREEDGRYETLPELATLNTGVDGAALANFDVFSYAVPDLMPAKAAIPETQGLHDTLRTRTQGRRIDIGTEEKIKKQQNNILLAFQAAGLKDSATFSAAPAKWAYLGLLDYVDADNEPAGGTDEEKFARPATEAMPLFSLAVADLFYSASTNAPTEAEPDPWVTHTVKYLCSAQFDYPFQTVKGPFTLEAEMTFFNTGGQTAWGESELLPQEPVMLRSTIPNCGPGNEFEVVNNTSQLVKREVKKRLSAGRPALLSFAVGTRGWTKNSSGKVIRRTPAIDGEEPPMMIITMTGADFRNSRYPDVPSLSIWSEAMDARFNWSGIYQFWRASRDDNWVDRGSIPSEAPLNQLAAFANGYVCPPEPNLKNMNSLGLHMLSDAMTMTDYFRIITDEVRVGDYENSHLGPFTSQRRAHVADGPLQSVGELGYLPIGLWLTIALYDHGHAVNSIPNDGLYPNNILPSIGYHPVLDYFVIGDPDKGRRGLVNLNTRNREVLGTVFNKLPVQTELYTHTPASPGPVIPSTTAGNCNDAVELAQWLQGKGSFERLSDLGRFFKVTPQLGSLSGAYTAAFPLSALCAAVGGGIGEFEREALIRNACNLVTLRGQTFTIILRADAFSPRFGMRGVKQGNVLATAMAVAQVWRDTEPMVAADGTKNYPTFVQFFKILNE